MQIHRCDHSVGEDCIVAADGGASFEVVFTGVVHLVEPTRAGQHGSTQPDGVALVGVVQHLHIDGLRLNRSSFTLDLETASYFLSLSSTLSRTLRSSLSLKPLKRVDPPESAILL